MSESDDDTPDEALTDVTSGSDEGGFDLTRRELGAAAAGVAGASGLGLLGLRRLTTDTDEADEPGHMNPFEEYPNQGWEDHYRDVLEPDDS